MDSTWQLPYCLSGHRLSLTASSLVVFCDDPSFTKSQNLGCCSGTMPCVKISVWTLGHKSVRGREVSDGFVGEKRSKARSPSIARVAGYCVMNAYTCHGSVLLFARHMVDNRAWPRTDLLSSPSLSCASGDNLPPTTTSETWSQPTLPATRPSSRCRCITMDLD